MENCTRETFNQIVTTHINDVRELLGQAIKELYARGEWHDRSKFSEEETPLYVEYTPRLKACPYGSEEYMENLKGLKPALDNHYKKNRHHPEHYKGGYKDMSLIDMLEMLADWYASSKRHAGGDIFKSIEYNQSRYGYSNEIKELLLNTVRYLDWTN